MEVLFEPAEWAAIATRRCWICHDSGTVAVWAWGNWIVRPCLCSPMHIPTPRPGQSLATMHA